MRRRRDTMELLPHSRVFWATVPRCTPAESRPAERCPRYRQRPPVNCTYRHILSLH